MAEYGLQPIGLMLVPWSASRSEQGRPANLRRYSSGRRLIEAAPSKIFRALTAITSFPNRATGQMVLVLVVEGFDEDASPEILPPILCSQNMLSLLEEAIPKMREQLRTLSAVAN